MFSITFSNFGGITPIYMGSTTTTDFLQFSNQDHPHIHGEHLSINQGLTGHQGSPPYTWGAHIRSMGIYPIMRITPIYMGSTDALLKWVEAAEDHPHIHGEHATPVLPIKSFLGSPPYTWGAHNQLSFTTNADGITPIYMGSTRAMFRRFRPPRDHPHIHGEHVICKAAMPFSSGSPPYTWGAQAINFVI